MIEKLAAYLTLNFYDLGSSSKSVAALAEISGTNKVGLNLIDT